MSRIVYYAASSLDGRLADENNNYGFLETLGSPEAFGQYSFSRFFAGVDGFFMGATTYRVIAEHGEWPYGSTPCWVVTHAHDVPLVKDEAKVEVYGGDLRKLRELFDDRGLKRVWFAGGGDLAGQLLALDMVDEVILAIAPTFVGNGPALAEGRFPQWNFRLADVQQFTDGVVLRYERQRIPDPDNAAD